MRRELSYRYLSESDCFDDVAPAMTELRGLGARTGIVTSARYDHINRINIRSKVLDLLPILAAREDVGDKTKPDPEGLLIACRKLELDPSDCLYVGDACFDTEAAWRLGMHSAFIDRTGIETEDRTHALKYATYDIRSLREVPGIMQQ